MNGAVAFESWSIKDLSVLRSSVSMFFLGLGWIIRYSISSHGLQTCLFSSTGGFKLTQVECESEK